MRATYFVLLGVLAAGCGEDFAGFRTSSTSTGIAGSGAEGGGGDGAAAGGGAGGAGAGGFDAAEDPSAQINHPGDAECREVNVPLLFSGTALDPQEGMLVDGALAWTSNLEGPIGTGESFMRAPTVAGVQVITLTASDSDGNAGFDEVTLNVAAQCP